MVTLLGKERSSQRIPSELEQRILLVSLKQNDLKGWRQYVVPVVIVTGIFILFHGDHHADHLPEHFTQTQLELVANQSGAVTTSGTVVIFPR